MPETMRRVDWRWAVTKGYLNKETNEWNEAMGGREAYLKQRNDRMLARYALNDHFYGYFICQIEDPLCSDYKFLAFIQFAMADWDGNENLGNQEVQSAQLRSQYRPI